MIKKNSKIISNIKERLWRLSGGDYLIIRNCPDDIRNTFMYVGIFVCINFFVCFLAGLYSLYYFFYSERNNSSNWSIVLPVSIFFAWMVINIYLVLLTTLTKKTLPHFKNQRASFISNGIRILFVLFVAIVISKPLECFLFQKNLYMVEKIDSHKKKLINDIIENNSSLSQSDKSMVIEKIQGNYFFSFRLRNVNHIPFSWGITLLIAILFFIPPIITYKIPENSLYYFKKRKWERKLIVDEYEKFLLQYRKNFNDSIGTPMEFKPVCIVTEKKLNPNSIMFGINKWKEVEVCYPSKNPPFNTKPLIPNRQYKSQNDFINLIHGG